MNKFFDHTLLKPEATPEQIDTLCKEAIASDFYSVCVNSCYVPRVSKALNESDVKTCAVVGFPLGACSTDTKVFETRYVCNEGADEVDMVLNVGMLKGKDYNFVRNDISKVVEAAHDMNAKVKVILETCLLSDTEIVMACELSMEAGADFVKTSTGFNTGGATVKDVMLMKKTVGSSMKVKASGGIRDLKTVKAMIEAGADRIGASAGVKIMEEAKSKDITRE
ncbi:deoxyribose-phosphate aldolase [Anaerovoracaceae bacterium SGI.195]